MLTGRRSLITVAGVVGAVLVSFVGPSFAQMTTPSEKTTPAERHDRRGAVKEKAQMKWESLTPEQQEAVMKNFNADLEKAKEKWATLSPEQQQKAINQAKSAAAKGKMKWEALTPEQRDAMKAQWGADAAKSKAKWQALTPEEQQKMIADAKAKVPTK
jgi:predicted Fe-S protein YdhL (DUF1289 family)